MNNSFIKNIQFLPLLLLAPVFYLVSWLLPGQAEEDLDQELVVNQTSIEKSSSVASASKQLATQTY